MQHLRRVHRVSKATLHILCVHCKAVWLSIASVYFQYVCSCQLQSVHSLAGCWAGNFFKPEPYFRGQAGLPYVTDASLACHILHQNCSQEHAISSPASQAQVARPSSLGICLLSKCMTSEKQTSGFPQRFSKLQKL